LGAPRLDYLLLDTQDTVILLDHSMELVVVGIIGSVMNSSEILQLIMGSREG
jgi:hypothetical protein